MRASIEAGARTRQQVTSACGAGDGCGTCHRTIKALIVECRTALGATVRRPTPAVFCEASPSPSA